MRLPSSRVDRVHREEIWVSSTISFSFSELRHVASSRRYLLISPCRDEAQYLRRTLDSVAAQSVPPALWVVVDDGSTDETPAILEEYARRLPYLRVVRRTDRGGRQVGPGVIEAFYAGLETVRLEDFDYVCKLDMDLDLPVRYFELLMQRMESDPRIGTTSGKPWFLHPQSGVLVPEVCGDEMSVGMTKFYRVACFKEIGGFVRQVMWDGIDCHRARMLGWIAESFDHEPVRFVHLRPQGTSHKGVWTGRLRGRVRAVLHGHLAPLPFGGSNLPPAILPRADWQCGYAVGLFQELAQRPAALRRPRIQALPALLPARLPAYGQASRNRSLQCRARPSLARQPPGVRVPGIAPASARVRGPTLSGCFLSGRHGCGGTTG